MEKILKILQGKKTSIATIISLILVFLLGRGYLAQDVVELISGIMVALGLSVNIASAKYRKNKK